MSDKEENKFYDIPAEDMEEEMTDYDPCFFCPMIRYCPMINQLDEDDIEDYERNRPKHKKKKYYPGKYPNYPKKYPHYKKKYPFPFIYPYMFPFLYDDWDDGWDEESDWD